MDFSQGILTVFGGMTSHAAVVARGMGRAAVVGCGALKIDEEAKTLTVGDKVYHEPAVCASAPMRIPRATPSRLSSSVLKASACAVPSTCSSRRIVSRLSVK